MKTILLIELKSTLFEDPSLGLENIKAYCNKYCKQQYNIKIKRFLHNDISEPLEYIKENNPFLLGFTMYAWNADLTVEIIAVINKEFPEIKIVTGGPSVSEDILNNSNNIVVWGEGEQTFTDILEYYEGGGNIELIKGLSYYKEGKQHDNERRPPIEDLDIIPAPYLLDQTLLENTSWVNIESSRGCCFNCLYCIWNRMSSGAQGLKYYSIKYLDKLLKHILLREQTRYLCFVDSIFNINKKRLKKITTLVRKYNKNKKTGIILHIYAEYLDKGTVDELKDIGVEYLNIGLQSVDAQVNKSQNRPSNFLEFDRGMKLVDAAKIKNIIGTMYALPYDNFFKHVKTFKYLYNNCKYSMINSNQTIVFRNSGLYKEKEKLGIKTTPSRFSKIIATNTQNELDIKKTGVFADQASKEKTLLTKLIYYFYLN